MEKLAEALRKAIDDKNHSLRAAAREMNVATGTVEGWKNGWRKPLYKHVRPIANYVNEQPMVVLEWIEASSAMRPYRDSALAFAS